MKRKHKYIQLADKLCCIECEGAIRFEKINPNNGLFVCMKCANLYVLKNDITVCLPKNFETRTEYQHFFKSHANFFSDNPALRTAIKRIIRKLPEARRAKWEDEDVKYWDFRYTKAIGALSSLRLYTREKYLFGVLRNTFRKGDYILEIGSGLAESVSRLLSPLSYPYTYIASDYSYKALTALKRVFKKRKNIVYIQCLGNRIPFKPDSIDHIICLGVLHHMPKKEKHLTGIIRALRSGGLLLLNEVYTRKYQLPPFIAKHVEHFIEPAHSEHEERVNWRVMKRLLTRGGSMIIEKHEYSPVRTALVRLFTPSIERWMVFTKLVIFLDDLTIQSLGKLWKLFDAGACLIVFRKNA